MTSATIFQQIFLTRTERMMSSYFKCHITYAWNRTYAMCILLNYLTHPLNYAVLRVTLPFCSPVWHGKLSKSVVFTGKKINGFETTEVQTKDYFGIDSSKHVHITKKREGDCVFFSIATQLFSTLSETSEIELKQASLPGRAISASLEHTFSFPTLQDEEVLRFLSCHSYCFLVHYGTEVHPHHFVCQKGSNFC